MGMLGAMAGAGKGLRSYSKTLGEKRKLDWQANQQELTAQRNINLENIRAGNARKLEGVRQSAQTKRHGETIALGEEQLAATTESNRLEIEARERMLGTKGEQQLEQIGKTGEVQVSTVKDLRDIEDKATKDAWEKTVNSEEYKKLPEGLKRLTAVQFSISGDVDLAKLMAGMGSTGMGGTGSKLKTPTAKHWEFAMDKLMEWKPFEKLSPPAQLAMSAKVASQAANNQPIEFGGDVLNPDKYAKYAQKIADGKMSWGDVRHLDPESIDGIGLEYHKLHPSTKLDYEIKKPSKRAGVMRDRGGDVDITGFESGAEGLSASGIYGKIKGAFEGLKQQGAQ